MDARNLNNNQSEHQYLLSDSECEKIFDSFFDWHEKGYGDNLRRSLIQTLKSNPLIWQLCHQPYYADLLLGCRESPNWEKLIDNINLDIFHRVIHGNYLQNLMKKMFPKLNVESIQLTSRELQECTSVIIYYGLSLYCEAIGKKDPKHNAFALFLALLPGYRIKPLMPFNNSEQQQAFRLFLEGKVQAYYLDAIQVDVPHFKNLIVAQSLRDVMMWKGSKEIWNVIKELASDPSSEYIWYFLMSGVEVIKDKSEWMGVYDFNDSAKEIIQRKLLSILIDHYPVDDHKKLIFIANLLNETSSPIYLVQGCHSQLTALCETVLKNNDITPSEQAILEKLFSNLKSNDACNTEDYHLFIQSLQKIVTGEKRVYDFDQLNIDFRSLKKYGMWPQGSKDEAAVRLSYESRSANRLG